MVKETVRQHEVQFCSNVSKWVDKLFETNTALPFGSSDIESFGRGSQKRQDFRVYQRKTRGQGGLALCGEVKLPGTPQGRTPFDPILTNDAFNKARQENCRYFFTWNVEQLALFDRSLWDAPTMHEQCIGQWKLGLELNRPDDITRAEVIARIRDEFLPRFFTDFGDIWSGKKKSFSPPPDEFYVDVLESHLSGPMGPVRELIDYLGLQSDKDAAFDARLRNWMTAEQQWNFDRNDPQSWRDAVDRAARSMVYVLSNRILFYQAVRLRNRLPELDFPKNAKTPQKALDHLRDCFEQAVEKTDDYDTVFFPEEREWAALTALSGVNSIEAWGKFISAVEKFRFKDIATDILGHVFQKMISPEERHKFGQHYTDETIVDVINAFCIRKAEANVLDPACGSGSFLVRAYYRKQELDKRLSNQELLKGLYGCDINPFPAHLATLNLAARNISNEENYPRVSRRNFFTVAPGKPFCVLPMATRDTEGNREKEEIKLPKLDAIIGNPPYVRHENIPRADKGVIHDQTKEHIFEVVARAWPELELSKQSDLHVYFWPVAAQFLSDNGWFGFLTSSSWLDVRYGFQLQRWVLLNFRLVAVIESIDEPWFEDARVKTAVTILQRSNSESERNNNLVRFVRLKRPLVEILDKSDNESQKQHAAEKLRDMILKTKSELSNDRLRIMVKRQSDLWHDGVLVAQMFARQKALAAHMADEASDDDQEDSDDEQPEQTEMRDAVTTVDDYGGGKWGRYLRAPDFYFDVMREFGSRFTRLGEVATIKFGIKSGCDAFFMPRDVSVKHLEKYSTEIEWQTIPLMRRCKRSEVENGNLTIIQAGDKTLHPIESKFVRPEVHSLMQVDRPVVLPKQLDRVVLWVDQPLKEIKGTFAYHYITWGSKQTFASNKSKSVPVPERSTCAGRNPWYDVTGLEPGIGFWPMAQQYRHIIPANVNRLSCNHNLFDVHDLCNSPMAARALMPVLNSTLIALIKTFYGRYAGTEGNLKTEVVDVVMLEVPDPRNITEPILNRLETAFKSMQSREITHLVEEAFLRCHTAEEVGEAEKLPLGLPLELQRADRGELDDAVFELLGVTDAGRRKELVDQLYREVALHFRSIRIVEVKKMEQRRHGSAKSSLSPTVLAANAWNELEPEWQKPLSEWLEEQIDAPTLVNIPDGEVRLPDIDNFFEATTLYFGKKPQLSHVCANRPEAELLYAIAAAGLRGSVPIPATEKECVSLHKLLETRLKQGEEKLRTLAEQYAGSDKLRDQIADVLQRRFIQGT